MLRPGLVSVTFRSLEPREIIAQCVGADLEGIEWGGDVHVPPGDLKIATEVGKLTRDAGLEVACYGSYYRCDRDAKVPFSAVLDSAQALGAPLIRVWAGSVDAKDAVTADFARVIADLERISALALAAKIQVVTEFHGGTLTANAESARYLMEVASQAGAGTLWQPLRRGKDFDPQINQNVAELRAMMPYLRNVHVYEWADDAEGNRKAFSLENSVQWPHYIEELQAQGGKRFLLLEFLPEEGPDVLKREAAALRRWLSNNA